MNSTVELRKSSERPNWLVFSDDWGRHPSSCQYIIAQLLDKVNVTWVNTIGMRKPKLDAATFRRIIGKLKTVAQVRLNPIEKTSAYNTFTPHVINPLMWPWFSRGHDRC